MGKELGRLCLQPCVENKPQKFLHLHPGRPSSGFHGWLEFAITGSEHPSVQAGLAGPGQEAQRTGLGVSIHPGAALRLTSAVCGRAAPGALPEPHRDTLFCGGQPQQPTARPCTLQRSSSPFSPRPTAGGAAGSGEIRGFSGREPGNAQLPPSILRAALLWHTGALGASVLS